MNKSKIVLATFCLIVTNVFVGVFFMTRTSPKSCSPDLLTPRLAVAALEGKRVYYTPAAREELRAQKPDLCDPPDERAFEQAMQNPALWRQLDHRLHFDTLLFSGDTGSYRPLLRHLIETRDWTLTYLDHSSMIWKKAPAPPWKPESLDALKQKFEGAERAAFLVGAANKLLAIGMAEDAKRLLDEAVSLDRKSAEARTELALYYAQLRQWTEALTNCDLALSLDENYAPALSAKAQIFFGAKRFNDALDISRRAVEAYPRDPAALFLDAKIAHEAHAFQHEIETMRKLVALAENEGAPISGYRIYLAQAYAADRQAQPALEEFQKSAADDDLSAEQRKFIEESIARIKSRM